MRHCHHASASVGVQIYIYGGLKGENSPFHSEINPPAFNRTSPKLGQSTMKFESSSYRPLASDVGSEMWPLLVRQAWIRNLWRSWLRLRLQKLKQ